MEIDDGHIEILAKSLYHRREMLQLGPQPETGPRNGTFGGPVRDKLLQFSGAKIDHRLQDCTAMPIYGNSWRAFSLRDVAVSETHEATITGS